MSAHRERVPKMMVLQHVPYGGPHDRYLVTCYGRPLVIANELRGKRNEHPI